MCFEQTDSACNYLVLKKKKLDLLLRATVIFIGKVLYIIQSPLTPVI